jgi:hypothetical protein
MKTHSSTFETTLEIDEVEVELKVAYTFHPAYRGARDGRFGPPIEPDEPACVEIDSVTNKEGKEIELSEENLAIIQQRAEEDLGDDSDDYPEPDYDDSI